MTVAQPVQVSEPADSATIVQQIRSVLGHNQSGLATVLGVSAKAVQSYEQGWRSVPKWVMLQLMILLALYRRQTMDDIPCWETVRCPAATRDRCVAFDIGRGQFCWFIGNRISAPPCAGENSGQLSCLRCRVFERLLRGPVRSAVDSETYQG